MLIECFLKPLRADLAILVSNQASDSLSDSPILITASPEQISNQSVPGVERLAHSERDLT